MKRWEGTYNVHMVAYIEPLVLKGSTAVACPRRGMAPSAYKMLVDL